MEGKGQDNIYAQAAVPQSFAIIERLSASLRMGYLIGLIPSVLHITILR